jgi:chitinase
MKQCSAAKGHYIDSAGLKGFAVWDVAGDYDNILLDSISSAMGIENDC